MSIEDFLAQVQPGVTLYGVLLALALIAFRAALWMRDQEKELTSEELQRVKELMLSFRHQFIEPILLQQFRAVTSASYDRALEALCRNVREVPEGAGHATGVASVIDARSVRSLTETLASDDTLVEGFLLSKSGEEFLNRVDARYRGLRDLVKNYQGSIQWARVTAYLLFVQALLFVSGMLRALAPWGTAILGVWLVLVCESFVLGVVSFGRYELLRVRLRRQWEQHEIYGQM